MSDKRTWAIEVAYAENGKLGVYRGYLVAPTLEEAKAQARKKIARTKPGSRVIAVGTY